MPRQPKGTVVIDSLRGRLRLRLPRQLFGGEQRDLYLGLPDTPTNRQAAIAKAKQIEADIAFDRFDPTLEKYKAPSYVPELSGLPNLVDLWEMYTIEKAKSLSVTTIAKDFKKTANHIASLPSQDLSNARAIRRHLLDSLTPDAAKRVLTQIRACCNWAVDEELIPINPFADLKISPGRTQRQKKINPFTRAERDMIIAGFEKSCHYSHYTPFVKFLFLTGCRPSEAIALQWRHIDPDLISITFAEAFVLKTRKDTKTHKIRKFPVNSQLRSLLTQIKPPQSTPTCPVFTSKEGALIDQHNFLNRAWKDVLSQLPITYRPQYNTRHTFITLCLEAKIPVAQVAAWAGNSAKTIWEHYAGIVNIAEVPEM